MLKNSSIEIIKNALETNNEEHVAFLSQRCIEFVDKIKEICKDDEEGPEKERVISILIDKCLAVIRSDIEKRINGQNKEFVSKMCEVLANVSRNELLKNQ